MLKRLLGFPRSKKETSFDLPDHVTTTEENFVCFLSSLTTREHINLKVFPTKSSCSFLPKKSSCSLSVTYQKNQFFYQGDLAGHIFSLPQLPNMDPKVQVLQRKIAKQFLVTEETFRNHLTTVLSETCLSSSTQKHLATHISKQEALIKRKYRRGFIIEVEINVEEDHELHIACGCKGREEACCPRRVRSGIHVAKQVTGKDCAICLTGLSCEGCRTELRCSHVFHTGCVMKWLENHASCPICRLKATGEIALFY